MCSDLFKMAKGKLDCPIEIIPECHPAAHVIPYLSVRKRRIMLTCSRCDQVLTSIHVRSIPRRYPRKRK